MFAPNHAQTLIHSRTHNVKLHKLLPIAAVAVAAAAAVVLSRFVQMLQSVGRTLLRLARQEIQSDSSTDLQLPVKPLVIWKKPLVGRPNVRLGSCRWLLRVIVRVSVLVVSHLQQVTPNSQPKGLSNRFSRRICSVRRTCSSFYDTAWQLPTSLPSSPR